MMDDTGLINKLEGLPVTIYVTFAAKDGFRSIPHTGTLTTESAKALIVEFDSAGYRRLPEGEAPLVPDEKVKVLLETAISTGEPMTGHYLLEAMGAALHSVVVAQRDADMKWARGEK